MCIASEVLNNNNPKLRPTNLKLPWTLIPGQVNMAAVNICKKKPKLFFTRLLLFIFYMAGKPFESNFIFIKVYKINKITVL